MKNADKKIKLFSPFSIPRSSCFHSSSFLPLALFLFSFIISAFLPFLPPLPPSLPADQIYVNFFLVSFGKFFTTAVFQLQYLYTGELMPTKVRNIAVGSSSMMARIGCIITPYIITLLVSPQSPQWWFTPYITKLQ